MSYKLKLYFGSFTNEMSCEIWTWKISTHAMICLAAWVFWIEEPCKLIAYTIVEQKEKKWKEIKWSAFLLCLDTVLANINKLDIAWSSLNEIFDSLKKCFIICGSINKLIGT